MKEEAVNAAVNAMVDAGLQMAPEMAKNGIFEIYRQEGIEFQEVFDRFLTRVLGEIDHKILAAGIVAYRKAREAALVLYPHVNLTLMKLMKKGFKLAVLSDAPRKQAWLRLCYLNLQHAFDRVITFEDTGVRKPDPAPFKLALELLKVKPEETLMVGDWPERDMIGASNLGIHTVYARYGDKYNRLDGSSSLEIKGVDFIIDDISQILKIVEKLSEA
jgi:putative hydrolase of the HAD superfamily